MQAILSLPGSFFQQEPPGREILARMALQENFPRISADTPWAHAGKDGLDLDDAAARSSAQAWWTPLGWRQGTLEPS